MQSAQLSSFGEILLFLVGGMAFMVLTLLVAKLIRPSRPNQEKLTTYECGEDPTGTAWGQFNPRFYIIALIFILFDVEIAFLFPWATVFGNATLIEGTNGLWGWFAVAEMFIFVAVLALGLAYAWAKGFLDWIKPNVEKPVYRSPVPRSLYDRLNHEKHQETVAAKQPG